MMKSISSVLLALFFANCTVFTVATSDPDSPISFPSADANVTDYEGYESYEGYEGGYEVYEYDYEGYEYDSYEYGYDYEYNYEYGYDYESYENEVTGSPETPIFSKWAIVVLIVGGGLVALSAMLLVLLLVRRGKPKAEVKDDELKAKDLVGGQVATGKPLVEDDEEKFSPVPSWRVTVDPHQSKTTQVAIAVQSAKSEPEFRPDF